MLELNLNRRFVLCTLVNLLDTDTVDEAVFDKANYSSTVSIKRPTEEVILHSLCENTIGCARSHKDPTSDVIDVGLFNDNVSAILSDDGFLVLCKNSADAWFAHNKQCLDANFIYRSDLNIIAITDEKNGLSEYHEFCSQFTKGIPVRKKCYLLDNPINETYEVYYDADYPLTRYGKSVPDGMSIRIFKNRFHRDMKILELDDKYSNQSSDGAKRVVSKSYEPDEAIIVSDGCMIQDTCSSSFYYMDATSLLHTTESHVPSNLSQGVLISEIYGAYLALKMCVDREKHNITYYYDNTSIVNVFRNKKLHSVDEIYKYKKLCEYMRDNGYTVNFVELHPKTGENRKQENKALMYFHNMCDRDCRNMSDVFKKDYKAFATKGNQNGMELSKVCTVKKPKKYSRSTKSSEDVFSSVKY